MWDGGCCVFKKENMNWESFRLEGKVVGKEAAEGGLGLSNCAEVFGFSPSSNTKLS